MTYPRSHLIDPDEPGCYHLISQCVRRSFLCGLDPLTGIDYSYRQGWLETRLLDLTRYFALDVYAYAVMSNHYHIVINTDPRRADGWSAAEIAERWVHAMCNPDRELTATELRTRVEELLAEPAERIEVLRARLKSVSWYMARINEPMARRCNLEDNCKGHFWEGRFHSGTMLDESATLKCMVYADLNPVRAGVAKTLEDSAHTGIRRRIQRARRAPESLDEVLRSLTVNDKQGGTTLVDLTTRDYIALVQWTGENIVHPDKASLPPGGADLLRRLGIELDSWSDQVLANAHRLRAYGTAENVRAYAKRIGRRWVRGGPRRQAT